MSLAVGRPILVGVRGDTSALVSEAGAGVAFEPESGIGLADAVATLVRMSPAERDRLAGAGRRYYNERLSFHRGVEAVLRVYASMRGAAAS
jgi:glycosyltransferase involved in cell wall biosynthesis